MQISSSHNDRAPDKGSLWQTGRMVRWKKLTYSSPKSTYRTAGPFSSGKAYSGRLGPHYTPSSSIHTSTVAATDHGRCTTILFGLWKGERDTSGLMRILLFRWWRLFRRQCMLMYVGGQIGWGHVCWVGGRKVLVLIENGN